MKTFSLQSVKSLLFAVCLMATASAMAANEIGQPVTEFTEPEQMKLNWPYKLSGPTRLLLKSHLLTFKISAPQAGKYAVEYVVNATGSNIQLAATASKDVNTDEAEPDISDFVHLTSATDEDLPEPVVEEGVEPFVPAEPVTVYSAVDLQKGTNYVHVWMHVYWRNDALPTQKVQFKSIRLLPEGSGDVGEVAARASQKAFRVKFFRSLQDAITATMVADYEALVKAIGNDYTKADTVQVAASMAQTEAKEQSVRHEKGVVVNGDSTRIDLLLYHSEYNNPTTMAPLGGYDESGAYEMELGMEDYPAQLEFTRGNYFTYKFTAADDLTEEGSWYIQYLASSQNSATIDMTILAEDSATVVMPTYRLSTNNNAWQNYELMSKSDMAKFHMERGKTYYLHMYYNQYTNVRDILVRYLPREYHTAQELENLMTRVQNILWDYREGTDGYYIIEDRTLLVRMQELVDQAEEVVFGEEIEKVDKAYEELQDVLNQFLSTLKLLNFIPNTTDFDVTSFNSSNNCGYKEDGGIMQLDNFRSGGYIIYKVYNKQDAEYEVDFEFAHQFDGAQMMFQFFVEENGDQIPVSEVWSEQYESTGGWQIFEPKHLKIGAVPQGYVFLKISGEGNGQAYVGNPRLFVFRAIEGTEGAGAKALEAARTKFYAAFTNEGILAKIADAEAALAPYTGGIYDYIIVDRTPIENVLAAIQQAQEAIAADDGPMRRQASDALDKAIAGLKAINYYNVIPTTEEFPFNVNNGAVWDKWRSEGQNIGFGYEGGSVVYTVYVTEDAKYNLTVNMSNPAPANIEEKDEEGNVISSTPNEEHAMVRISAMQDENTYFETTYNVPNTGGWGNKEDVLVEGIPMPEGLLQVKFFGEKAVGGWVGNIYQFTFEKVAGSEGHGSKAVADGISETLNHEAVNSNAIYDLHGRKVTQMKKGLYIVNGKKILVR